MLVFRRREVVDFVLLQGRRPPACNVSKRRSLRKLRGRGCMRPVCFERQALEHCTREVLPPGFESFGDVLPSPIAICMGACPFCQLSQEQLPTATRASASSTGACAKARYAQAPGFSAPADTGPSARACDRPPFRRERVSRAADFRGAGATFPTDGIVTKSNSS